MGENVMILFIAVVADFPVITLHSSSSSPPCPPGPKVAVCGLQDIEIQLDVIRIAQLVDHCTHDQKRSWV